MTGHAEEETKKEVVRINKENILNSESVHN